MAEKIFSKSRRAFIKTSVTGAAALTILPSTVVSGLGHKAPSDKLNIAAVGVGGAGYRNLLNLEQENIVALCDIDSRYAEKSFRRWSRANTYTDYRVMLEKERNFDAVVVASPDHSHAVIAIPAIQLQKHVFVQAPMAHAIYDARRMKQTAEVYQVATQVGNDVASGDGTRQLAETIWAGAIGAVTTVHAWTKAPNWPQGIQANLDEMRVPNSLNWDLFLGPSKQIAYNKTYTPFGWRAWWQFGNGTLGYIAAQLLEPIFRTFMLDAPLSIQASSSAVNLNSAPVSQKNHFSFARRDNLPKLAMPDLELNWYDGGLTPALSHHLPPQILDKYKDGGLILEGEKGVLICGYGASKITIYNKQNEVYFETGRTLHRIEGGSDSHEKDWVRACKESNANRLPASASFNSQEALTETLLCASMAVRMQSLNRKLEWSSEQMRFSNVSSTDELRMVEAKNFDIQNGLVQLNTNESTYNAEQFVNETVRPVSRIGWMQL